MPALSVWAIRCALLYLGMGFTLGGLLLGARAGAISAALMRILPLHIELLLIGWMVQLAFGVGYWILPRSKGSRRSERLAWASLLLLNIGVLTTGIGGFLAAQRGVLVLGRVAELLAAFAFALHAWPRARLYSSLRGPGQ
jgi:heme/copper-type cytochrome/quinol oxidase subunit 1